jgi:hypothetical protein
MTTSQIPGGYILFARKTFDGMLMNKPPLYLKLWIWMLCQANFRNRNKLMRGQFVTSISEMRDAMSYKVGFRKKRPSIDQIRSAYEAFMKATMITTTKTTRGMIITILNYDYYQNPKNYEAHNETHDEASMKPTITPHDTEGIIINGMNENVGGIKIPPRENGFRPPVCPHQKIIELYHKILPELPYIQEWDNTANQWLRARWRSKPERSCLEFWEAFFNYIRKSKFLLNGKDQWIPDLRWIVKSGNFTKIINGNYHNNQTFNAAARWLHAKQRPEEIH